MHLYTREAHAHYTVQSMSSPALSYSTNQRRAEVLQ